jgi:hypothetical protein
VALLPDVEGGGAVVRRNVPTVAVAHQLVRRIVLDGRLHLTCACGQSRSDVWAEGWMEGHLRRGEDA